MTSPDKVLIVAPYWRKPQHVGVYRVERFVRWFSEVETEVVIVRAGRCDRVRKTFWGTEIEIRDPLGKSWDADPDTFAEARMKALRLGLNVVANWFFNPDTDVSWARRVARHPLVLEHGAGADLILASSPPESVHVAASLLAERLNARLIVDMRDGWLDEPLKAYLTKNPLLRWWEGRLERKILRQACLIFVTSDVWKEMLAIRLSFTEPKTIVLTNCYPLLSTTVLSDPPEPHSTEKCILLHAGSFTNSKFNNRPGLLLGRLWDGLHGDSAKLEVVLQGQLGLDDLSDIKYWFKKFAAKGVKIITRPPVAREQLSYQLQAAGGLLLLSATRASILAKFFEYLPSRRPILAVTVRDSSIWRLALELPQLFVIDLDDPARSRDTVKCFLNACITDQIDCDVPARFSEEQNQRIFLKQIGLSIRD